MTKSAQSRPLCPKEDTCSSPLTDSNKTTIVTDSNTDLELDRSRQIVKMPDKEDDTVSKIMEYAVISLKQEAKKLRDAASQVHTKSIYSKKTDIFTNQRKKRPSRPIFPELLPKACKEAFPLSNEPSEQSSGEPSTSQLLQLVTTRYEHIEPKIIRLFPSNINPTKVCPWVPRSVKEYLTLEAEIRDATAGYLEYRIQNIQVQGQPRHFHVNAFNGKTYGSASSLSNPSSLSPVLAQPTIFTPGPHVSWKPMAPWPSHAEMEWEGPSRIQTEGGRYQRMLPLPRLPESWPGATDDYKTNDRVIPYALDDVHPLPDYETIYHPPDEIEDDDTINHLLGAQLFSEMDNPSY